MTPIRLPRLPRYNWRETPDERHERFITKATLARAIQDAADYGEIEQAEGDELISGLRDSREMMADWLIDQHLNPL